MEINKDKIEGIFFIKLIFAIFIISFLLNVINYKTNYVVVKPGPLYKITYSDGEKHDNNNYGSFNMSTIAVKRLTSVEFLINYFKKNKDIYPLYKEEILDKNIDMLSAKETAAIVADALIQGIEPNAKLAITYISKNSNAERLGLKIGDIISKVDGINIINYNNLINNLNDGSNYLEIIRDDEYIVYNEVIVKPSEKLGVKLIPVSNSYINIDNIDTGKVGGASGGLMFTLVFIDHFTDGDLTLGRKISGSGTINLDGSIGAIDGVGFKYNSAINEKVDIFFVPSKNYDEIINSEVPESKIVKVDTIFDAINYLCKLGSDASICGKI